MQGLVRVTRVVAAYDSAGGRTIAPIPPIPAPLPPETLVAEDGITPLITEDGTTVLVAET